MWDRTTWYVPSDAQKNCSDGDLKSRVICRLEAGSAQHLLHWLLLSCGRERGPIAPRFDFVHNNFELVMVI
jgi:hypothetical protein